jgi:fucose permease
MVVGLLVEARLLLFARRLGPRAALAGSLAATGAALGIAAAFPALLPVALLVLYPLQGVNTGIAEAGAVAADPDEVERTMARWATFAAIGDLFSPLLCAGIAAVGGGWRPAFGVGAVWLLLHAVAAWRAGPPAIPEEDEDEPTDLRSLVAGLVEDRALTAALLATACCSLMDEILVVFGSLWLDERGVPAAERDLAFVASAAGLAVGAALVEPLLKRFSARTLLIAGCVGCGLAYGAWLWRPSVALLTLAGLFGAPLYPLAEARAWRLAPPERVAASARIVAIVDIFPPLLLGWVADHAGLRAALALLLLEPIVLLVVAVRDRR